MLQQIENIFKEFEKTQALDPSFLTKWIHSVNRIQQIMFWIFFNRICNLQDGNLFRFDNNIVVICDQTINNLDNMVTMQREQILCLQVLIELKLHAATPKQQTGNSGGSCDLSKTRGSDSNLDQKIQ